MSTTAQTTETNPFAETELSSWRSACDDDLTTDRDSSDEDNQVDDNSASVPAA